MPDELSETGERGVHYFDMQHTRMVNFDWVSVRRGKVVNSARSKTVQMRRCSTFGLHLPQSFLVKLVRVKKHLKCTGHSTVLSSQHHVALRSFSLLPPAAIRKAHPCMNLRTDSC